MRPGNASITSIELADDPKETPRIGRSLDVAGEVLRLLAANGHLVAVTRDGRVHVFGEDAGGTPVVRNALSVGRDGRAQQVCGLTYSRHRFTEWLCCVVRS